MTAYTLVFKATSPRSVSMLMTERQGCRLETHFSQTNLHTKLTDADPYQEAVARSRRCLSPRRMFKRRLLWEDQF